MKQQTPYGVEKCNYEGLMVEYARDREEVQPSATYISTMSMNPRDYLKNSPRKNVKAKFRCPLPGKVEMSAFAV